MYNIINSVYKNGFGIGWTSMVDETGMNSYWLAIAHMEVSCDW